MQLVLDALARNRSRALCGKNCTRPDAAVAYLGWNGSVESFNFSAPVFGFEFILANRRNVINLPYEVQGEIERYVAHKALLNPVHYSASTVQSNVPSLTSSSGDEQALTQALERIESLKGAAARRAAFENALGRIQAPHLRERLAVEAARIEVRSVLDKVDSLKSPAAKRRHIMAAIEQLRNDTVPDHLQAREIAALEDALRALGPS
ncbi:hypothetical protein [Sorangium sp. So ce1182]|uniref:hypothetical protein n=1 Tax=Sorangium sp. So ce1182 TaxID=3133334 RepID=UPI003F5F2A3B